MISMGLGEFESNDDDDSDGGRRYKRITQEEFEEFITDVDEDFYIVGTDEDPNLAFTREIVYARDFNIQPDVQLRVYSTIDKRTGKARDKGDDAIRTVIWSKKDGHPIAGETKTLRIETWKSNLAPKINDLIDEGSKFVERCECGSLMQKRDGEYGEFYGCIKYPACKNTKQPEQVEEDAESIDEIKEKEKEVMDEAGFELEEEDEDTDGFLEDVDW